MEAELQSRLIKKAVASGWYCLKTIQCNKPGWPDLMLMRAGRVIFIEVKQKGLKLRPLQEYRKIEIERLGFKYYLVDELDLFTKNLLL